MKNILFRCDASLTIGSGHVIRCRTLARKLKKLDVNVVFICRRQSGDLIELLQKEFQVLVLPEKSLSICEKLEGRELYEAWLGCSQEEDALDCLSTLNKAGILTTSWIVVDHYGLDVTWEQKLLNALKGDGGKTMLLAIDDLADRYHKANIILDQNYFENNSDERYRKLVPNNCKQLIGPHYALLGSEYAKLHPLVPNRTELRRILVFFGGVDPDNLTCKILKALMEPEFDDIAVDVVLGSQSPNRQLVEDLVTQRPNTTLYGSMPSLAGLITRADLGIGAGGSTTWERACLGLPSLVVAIADNQLPLARALEESEHIQFLGDKDAITVEKIRSAILDQSTKSNEQEAGRSLTDGWGASRVAMAMLRTKKDIDLRPADEADEGLLLRWANESKVRANSFSPKLIASEEHKMWYKQKLADNNHLLLIATDTNGCPIGQIRFDLMSKENEGELKEAKIDLSLDRCIRGHGLAVEIIQKGLQVMTQHWGSQVKAIAEVLQNNSASNACFARAKFKREEIERMNKYTEYSETVIRWTWCPEIQ